MRVKFLKGQQKKFLDLAIEKTNSPSLRGLIQFGFSVPYSTLKNYHNESRLLPKNLFIDLCSLSGIQQDYFKVIFLDENWGRVKGGRNIH